MHKNGVRINGNEHSTGNTHIKVIPLTHENDDRYYKHNKSK